MNCDTRATRGFGRDAPQVDEGGDHFRSTDDVRLEHSVRRNSITIVERRPPWSELVGPDWTSMKIAQLRYDDRSRTWSLYAADRNERWFLYNDVAPARDVGLLLAEISDDPTGIFWG